MANFDRYVTPNMLNLTDSYAVKILICYFLRQINRPITPDQLTEIATADGVINYFVYTEAMNQMLEAKTVTIVEEDGVSYYALSPIATAGADDFKKIVPKSFRDRILASGLKFFAKLKNDHDVKCTVEECDRGYTVRCICTDGSLVLMDLKLFAPDAEQAQMLRDRILLDPTAFYGKVLDFASDNEEYKPIPEEVNEF